MPSVISTKDGSSHIVMDLEDFRDLVREHIGFEADEWFSEYLLETYADTDTIDAVAESYEEDIKKMKARYKEALEEIRKAAERLADLIREPELNRAEISSLAGRIGVISWREAR